MLRSPLTCRFAIAFVLLCAFVSSIRADSDGAVRVARSYFEAMSRTDLDAAEALFDQTSSVFESGGEQGGWERYREHHIGPEIDEIVTFETTLGEAEAQESTDMSMAFVAWPIEYHIELQDGRTVDSKGTVTFVLVRTGEEYRIRHLHWSSRRMN